MKREGYRRDYEEMASYFYEFNFKELEDRAAKTMIERIQLENQRLRKEIKTVKKKLQQDKKIKKLSRRYSYREIFEDIEKRFDYLSSGSIASLATAEYLFLNEREGLDFSCIYISYVKVFEGELRRVFNSFNERITLGTLMKRLKEVRELRTFVEALERINIIAVRNRAVHQTSISKGECGKLRELLIGDKWLERVCYILDYFTDGKPKREVFQGVIVEWEGREKIGNKLYNCYTTDLGEYILSETNLEVGYIEASGVVMGDRGIEYIVI